jgi:hypothetical protein
MQEENATIIEEKQLIRWLFTECALTASVFEQLNLSRGARVAFDVAEPIINSHLGFPGDIDVLVYQYLKPEMTTAIECKRVKIKASTFETLKPNKLSALERGVEQTNGLVRIGFHVCWLLAIIVTNGRERIDFNFASRGPTPELVKIINAFPGREKLLGEVGLAFFELTQPLDKPIEAAGGIGFRIVRNPIPRIQDEKLTSRIRQWLQNRNISDA